MNEFLQRTRASIDASLASARAFYARNKILLLGGLTVLSILLIVWARLGFTLDVNRFYAAESECQTPSPGTHVASVLSVQCGATQNVLTWNLPQGNDTNALIRNVDGVDGVFIPAGLQCRTTTTYTDTNIQAGRSYRYVHKAFADRASNAVVCPPPTPTVTPTPSLTPTPTASLTPTPTSTTSPTPTQTTLPIDQPVVCAPAQQSVTVGQLANLQASGGNGVVSFSWDTPLAQSGDVTVSGVANRDLAVLYRTPGQFDVFAVAGTVRSVACRITVVAPVPPAPLMTLVVTGRNVSTGGPESAAVGALVGSQVEVIIRVRNASAEANLTNVVALGSLPNGLTYVNGSSSVNNAPVVVDSVTAGGLGIGSLGPLQEAVVRFSVRVNGASFPVGTTQASIVATVNADGAESQAGSIIVSVSRTAAGGAPTAVPTGPGDAVLVALLISGIVTLLYVSYTHSPFFRHHEAEALSGDQGPMDFRG